MQGITQLEFDALPVIDGIRQCPGYSDYSEICSFGTSCSFGEGCSFGTSCRFGDGCIFGEWCIFGTSCSFGEGCSFGRWCRFGDGCIFGKSCSFGERCRFGKWCRFDGRDCNAKPGRPLIQFDGFGSENRTTQFFNLESGIWVHCGCLHLTIDAFRDRVMSRYGDTGHGLIYLGMANMAEEHFRQLDERRL